MAPAVRDLFGMPALPTRDLDLDARRRGRAPAAVALLGVLAAVGVALAALLLLRDRGESPSPSEPSARPQPPRAVTTPLETPSPPRYELGRGMVLPAEGQRPTLTAPDPVASAARFQGTGRVEGYLDLAAGLAAPTRWTLVVEPSRVLIGGEHAEARRVEFSEGETSFTIEDLPLGGYELRAEAAGLSGATDYLLLARPDAQYAVVRLSLRPAAYVQGRVVDVEGTPVAGLPLLLAPADGSPPLATTSGPGGAWLFERVPDGEYDLCAGDVRAPLATPLDLLVEPPSLHAPDLVVPVLGSLELRVLDAAGLVVAGARVQGWGSAGGRIDVTTDVGGRAVARFLPLGRYSLSVHVPDDPGAGRVRRKVSLEAGSGQRVELSLEP